MRLKTYSSDKCTNMVTDLKSSLSMFGHKHTCIHGCLWSTTVIVMIDFNL